MPKTRNVPPKNGNKDAEQPSTSLHQQGVAKPVPRVASKPDYVRGNRTEAPGAANILVDPPERNPEKSSQPRLAVAQKDIRTIQQMAEGLARPFSGSEDEVSSDENDEEVDEDVKNLAKAIENFGDGFANQFGPIKLEDILKSVKHVLLYTDKVNLRDWKEMYTTYEGMRSCSLNNWKITTEMKETGWWKGFHHFWNSNKRMLNSKMVDWIIKCEAKKEVEEKKKKAEGGAEQEKEEGGKKKSLAQLQNKANYTKNLIPRFLIQFAHLGENKGFVKAFLSSLYDTKVSNGDVDTKNEVLGIKASKQDSTNPVTTVAIRSQVAANITETTTVQKFELSDRSLKFEKENVLHLKQKLHTANIKVDLATAQRKRTRDELLSRAADQEARRLLRETFQYGGKSNILMIRWLNDALNTLARNPSPFLDELINLRSDESSLINGFDALDPIPVDTVKIAIGNLESSSSSSSSSSDSDDSSSSDDASDGENQNGDEEGESVSRPTSSKRNLSIDSAGLDNENVVASKKPRTAEVQTEEEFDSTQQIADCEQEGATIESENVFTQDPLNDTGASSSGNMEQETLPD